MFILEMSENELEGTIPTEFSYLTSLNELDISFNKRAPRPLEAIFPFPWSTLHSCLSIGS